MADTISNQKISYGLNSLSRVAQTLIVEGKSEPIWLFYGNLGAGKTTLIKELCLQMGVDSNQLSSPTFSIINEYSSSSGLIYHFDFYRIKNETEILDLGIEEYFDSGNFCFIEWPDRLGSIMPQQFFRIDISSDDSNERILEYEKHG